MLLLVSGFAFGQTAVDRAGLLKQWRERCVDPDSDMRIAYIEEAIASGDVSVIRICLRLALESDDSDVRNLGLRAALASAERITLDVQIPKVLEDALESAGKDKKQLEEISKWYVMRDWKVLRSGLVFEIAEASVASGMSTLFVLAGLKARHDNYAGESSITGSRLTWVGRANLSQDDCKLDLSVQPGAELAGIFHCGRSEPFAVRGKLL